MLQTSLGGASHPDLGAGGAGGIVASTRTMLAVPRALISECHTRRLFKNPHPWSAREADLAPPIRVDEKIQAQKHRATRSR